MRGVPNTRFQVHLVCEVAVAAHRGKLDDVTNSRLLGHPGKLSLVSACLRPERDISVIGFGIALADNGNSGIFQYS
jgi:hypothetical protein